MNDQEIEKLKEQRRSFNPLQKRYINWRKRYLPNNHFSAFPLIFHFSYHKCLTSYFNKVFNTLSNEFYFRKAHFDSDKEKFESVISKTGQSGVYSVNNNISKVALELNNFRGSHFVRNPMDLIVSGLKYHQWTKEKWCVNPSFDWLQLTDKPEFQQFVESDPRNFPKNISYQDYLNSIGQDRGLFLEMIWRKKHFSNMLNWNYQDPNIIEFKYEEIINHETEVFEQIFDHYQLIPSIKKRGLELVELLSLKNASKSPTSHTRDGSFQQWRKYFSNQHLDAFEEIYPNMLEKLGYQKVS